MLEELITGIYKIVLTDTTIEQGVSAINIYMIPDSSGRSLMIDTGFHKEDCFNELQVALRDLNIDVENLDIFLTHRHHDHSGLASKFASLGARIYMNPEEERHPYDCLAYKPTEESVEAQIAVLRSVGVTEEFTPEVFSSYKQVTKLVEKHGEWVLAITAFPYQAVHAGNVFQYGNYKLKAVALKGHTYGQLGLMDEEHKIFFCADQLILGTSPIVATTYPDESLLYHFFESLEFIKHKCTEGWVVLSAHGKRMHGGEELRMAVDKIVYSYLDKSSLAKEVLQERAHSREAESAFMTTREIMEKVYHVRESPKDEPSFFKYKMTLTKTFSLLEYMHDIDMLDRREEEGVFYWQLKNE